MRCLASILVCKELDDLAPRHGGGRTVKTTNQTSHGLGVPLVSDSSLGDDLGFEAVEDVVVATGVFGFACRAFQLVVENLPAH